MISFPNRVWEKLEDGTYASRPVTDEDVKRRREVKDSFENKLAETT